jgi:hypothetical protein
VPRDPVVFGGIDQCAVHVPQHGARHNPVNLTTAANPSVNV